MGVKEDEKRMRKGKKEGDKRGYVMYVTGGERGDGIGGGIKR